MIKTIRRRTIKMLRDLRGELTEITYHYYPGNKPKLFVLAHERVLMSYAGVIATNVFNRIEDELEKRDEQRAAV